MSTVTLTSPARNIHHILAMPLNAVFVTATVIASAFFTVGMISNLGAERLQRGGHDVLYLDSPVTTGMAEEEFPFFDGEI